MPMLPAWLRQLRFSHTIVSLLCGYRVSSCSIRMSCRKKTAEDCIHGSPDIEINKKAKDSAGQASQSETSICRYCSLEITTNSAKKPLDCIREHIAPQRHRRPKALSLEAEPVKQPTTEDTLVRCREQEKESAGAIYDIVRALCFTGLCLEHG